MRNRQTPKNNTSGVVGVSFCKIKKKYRSAVTVKSKNINLGYRSKFINAVKLRWEAEKKYGYPNCNTTSSAYKYLKENDLTALGW